jgi:ElaB/YqjD/DUF883 family membrane-anchored ribosome-binding protein
MNMTSEPLGGTENMMQDLPQGQDPYLQNLVKATDDCIAHHPWGAIGIAVGFGLVFGLLLARGKPEVSIRE